MKDSGYQEKRMELNKWKHGSSMVFNLENVKETFSVHLCLDTAPLIIRGLINSAKKPLLSLRSDRQSHCYKILCSGE